MSMTIVIVATLHGFLEAEAQRQLHVSPAKMIPSFVLLTGICWQLPEGKSVP